MKLLKFDKDKALNGAKVVTRSGKKVEIHGLSRDESLIFGLVEKSSLGVQKWALDGSYLRDGSACDYDLFVLDESEELVTEPVVDSHKADVIAAYCDGRLSMLKNSPFLSGEDYYNKKFRGQK